jgi:type II secretory pathway pseudopilin PulG
MVAAVIAILALIILPLFQKRAEKAKIAAAQDDLKGLAHAEMLAYADASWYFRLQDLDNTQLNTAQLTPPIPDTKRDISVPYALWDRALTANERVTLSSRWQGPYIAVQTMSSTPPSLAQVRWPIVLFQPNSQGKYPILIIQDDNLDNDKIPTDPWGGPYIFYAPASETEYNTSYNYRNGVIYSMGPNGLPGDGLGGITSNNIVRDSPVTSPSNLGNGDDIKYVF